MLKKFSLILLLLVWCAFSAGCSDLASSGTSVDDSNLGTGMGMGMGGDVGSESADNTSTQGPIGVLESYMSPVSQDSGDDTCRLTKTNVDTSLEYAVLYCRDHNIMLLNAEEGQSRSLTKDGNADIYYSSPSWAVPGKTLLLVKTSANGSVIYTIDADGSSQRALLKSADIIDSATMSPDGKRIVYSAAKSGGIWITEISGSNTLRLLETKGSSPVWSPKGDKIAFAYLSSENKYDICTMNSDGTELKNLTRRFEVYGETPHWSPDGKRIVFSTGRDICIVESDGSGLTYLTNDDSKVRNNPYWLTNGTEIIFEYRMKPDGERYFTLMDLAKNTMKLFNADRSN